MATWWLPETMMVALRKRGLLIHQPTEIHSTRRERPSWSHYFVTSNVTSSVTVISGRSSPVIDPNDFPRKNWFLTSLGPTPFTSRSNSLIQFTAHISHLGKHLSFLACGHSQKQSYFKMVFLVCSHPGWREGVGDFLLSVMCFPSHKIQNGSGLPEFFSRSGSHL